jgi:hypothetical protein
MDLQTNAAKKNLWRSLTVITPKTGGSNAHRNKEKCPMTQPSFERPQPSSFRHNNSSSHGSFGGNDNKVASSSKGPRGQSKDVNAHSKGPSKSTSFKKI